MIQSFKVIYNILLYYHIFCDIVLLYFSNIVILIVISLLYFSIIVILIY